MLHKTLHKYWGYTSFRGRQEEIIQSLLSGHDTLALLPTGGGKSICYQVPAVMMEGVCFVVSPLIALMRDQVEQLKSRGISASYVHSGMSRRELTVEYESIRNGRYTLVYVSPERMQNPTFLTSFDQTNVSFIAVDEAHCISQWGHDFRPMYRQLASVRERKPELNILALTASATPQVKQDIIEQLHLKDVQSFEQGFYRENLHYLVRYEEDKRNRIVRLAQKVKHCGIVYVRNRRKTVELANYLKNAGISADYYHAGLSAKERNIKQDRWISDETQVIVSTNAFGMGIDKADVRFVVHYDLSDSLESYYQEAGRAGRDGEKAWCVQLYNESDIISSKTQISSRFPALSRVNAIYENVCNYFELAFHTGQDARFPFQLEDFCKKFENPALETYSALRILEQLNYLQLSDSVHRPSKVKMEVSSTVLYDFQLKNIKFDGLIKLLLRSYSGIFDHFVSINEHQLASRLKWSYSQLTAALNTLKQLKLLAYEPQSDAPFITFIQPRVTEVVDREQWLSENKLRTLNRFNALLEYVEGETCRASAISKYFGEVLENDCGKCDVCRLKERYAFSAAAFKGIEKELWKHVEEPKTLSQVIELLSSFESDDVKKVVRCLLDDDKMEINSKGELSRLK